MTEKPTTEEPTSKELITSENEIDSESTNDTTPESSSETSGKGKLWLIIGAVVLIAIIAGIVSLSFGDPDSVGKVRDIFIILMALMMFVIGVALVVLIIQLADLTNLLKNEVRPIMKSTTDTVNTLKGTVRFMSDHLTEPVIKLNESMAGLEKIASLFRFKK
ncbi:MAG: MnhB domain-containing protein [Anaerolineaceae bacterium]|nr:MnhB domain-containing protein [Anaerolineaceae bacterium]